MSEQIVLSEAIFGRCWVCGKQANLKMYEYYCSNECEEIDVERIRKAINAGEHPVTLLEAPLKMLSERTEGH